MKEKQGPVSKPVAPPISFVSSNSSAAHTTPTQDKPAPTMISSIPDETNGNSSLISNQKAKPNTDMLFSKFMCKMSVSTDASRFKKTTPPANKLD